MGTLVKCTYQQPKSAFDVSTVAAGAVVIGAGELGVFVGADNGARFQEIYSAIEVCMEEGQLKNFKNTAAKSSVEIHIGAASSSALYVSDVALPAFAETEVAIVWDEAYPYRLSSELFTQAITLLRERFQEDVAKVS
jgi:hypothetical protein